MINKDSRLYEKHPEWLIGTPGRFESHSRYQHVLDFTRKDVIDYLYGVMAELLESSKISYIKWDMNRSMSEAYGKELPSDRQGEFMHRYILGVYELYDRLTKRFPEILFESCSSGGMRFDPGMLYFAPQTWTSDDTDAEDTVWHFFYVSSCKHGFSCVRRSKPSDKENYQNLHKGGCGIFRNLRL